MACWRLPLMKMRSPPPVRPFALSAVTGTLTVFRKGYVHTHTWKSPQDALVDLNASVLYVVLYVAVCMLRIYMNYKRIQRSLCVSGCTWICLWTDTDGTCKYALVSMCVNVYAYILCVCVKHIFAELATAPTNVLKNKWFYETKP